MATLRNNHRPNQGKKSEGYVVRLAVFLIFLVILIVVLGYSLSNSTTDSGFVPAPQPTAKTFKNTSGAIPQTAAQLTPQRRKL